MNISQENKHYLIRIPTTAPDFGSKVAAVKKIPGRRWIEDRKMWVVPETSYPNINALLAAIKKHMAPRPIAPDQALVIDPLPKLTVQIPLKKKMYDFQGDGVAYNILHGSALIGDQPGLGKTIQAIASVVAMDLFPCLVITTNTLRLNWETEWKEWTNKEVLSFKRTRKDTWHFFFKTGLASVGIVNYDNLAPFFVNKIVVPKNEVFRVKHIFFKEEISIFKSIIIDESHYVKEGSTKRTKICIGLTNHLKERGVFLLSGTPVLNKAMEIYTQLTILNRAHLFGSYSQFEAAFCGKSNKNRLPQLKQLLHKHCYYRRLKSEVKKDLPPKTRQVILCDIDNRQEYDLAESNFLKYLREKLKLSAGQIDKKLRGEVMVQMGILKKIAARGKMDAVKEWVNNLLDAGEKVVLFAYHRDIQQQLVASFPNAVAIASQQDTPLAVIEENKRKFQTSKDTNVIVCSIAAAAEGHTLNAACNLAMVELPWHFGKMEQCEDRIHRITNTMPAYITTFLAEGTIDRKIYKLIMQKKELHEAISGVDENEEEVKVIDQIINLFNQQ